MVRPDSETATMRFEKWEALGNDFVLVAAAAARHRWGDSWLAPERFRDLCDRRCGVGADGVLVIDEIDSSGPSMIVINADGSRPEMCGNGVRCVAGLVAEHRGLEQGTIDIQSDAGTRPCEIRRLAVGTYEVSVGMGLARVGSRFRHAHGSRDIDLVHVDVGNPHAVTFDDVDPDALDELGPSVGSSLAGGANVELCRAVDGGRRVDVAVFERGVGRTLACGTGACAAAAAAVAQGRCEPGQPVEVRLTGGTLAVTVEPTDVAAQFSVRMLGPARRVFTGELS